ncbi:MAG: hypothetical protein VX589_04310 [Myxococcota bacterium]|nr:hypothetical protein [Myxococcota bacterium]
MNGNDEVVAEYDVGEDGPSKFRSEFAQAANGHSLLAYEITGPNRVGYVVIDAAGNLISPPRHVTLIAPDQITAAAFAHGDFAIMMSDPDAVATVQQVISNAGYSIGQEEPLGVVNVDDSHPIAWSSGDNETIVLYDPPSGNTRTVSFAPGYLSLEKTNDTELRLYNDGAQPADVMLSVYGSL